MKITSAEVAKYCKGCFYYRGVMKQKKQCYYRVWEEQDVLAPSIVLRWSGRCEHVRRTKRT
jgi:hypothetical protein